jgi:hypothetical protein
MADDLDAKPFGEEERASPQEGLITSPMVNKATHLIHKLADRRGADFKEIQKKCRKLLNYENLAKVSMEQGHAIIDKLVELTGGEEEGGAKVTDDDLSPQLPSKPSDRTKSAWPTKNEERIRATSRTEQEELEADIGDLAKTMLFCVRESKAIVRAEFGKENLTEGTRATLIKSYAATMFIEAGKRGFGR